jgi:hypothetical protein
MKRGLLVAFLILAGACDDGPPRPGDAAEVAADAGAPDAAGADAIGSLDGAADLTPAPDTTEASADGLAQALDASTADAGAGDVAAVVEAGAAADASPAGTTCGPGASREMLCTTYCDGVGRFCTGANSQYKSAEECRTACNGPGWACGTTGETMGNSLFCRLAHAALAGVGDPAKECANAGANSPTCL